MTAHPDILDQQEPLGKWMAASIALHVAVAVALLAHTFIGPGKGLQLGDPNGGGFGAVTINPVAQIPLPAKAAPTNPVANDTPSSVPAPPPKVKREKVKAPEPDAVAIGKREKRMAPAPAASARNTFREQQTFSKGQLYTDGGQQANTAMLGRQGAGGVGPGNSMPFGAQFGYYASILQQTIARNWKTGDIDPRIASAAPSVTVSFTIQKDGTVAPNSVRITQRSGIVPLDFSAQRAILDSSPFPPLPQGFPRDQAYVEFVFDLSRNARR